MTFEIAEAMEMSVWKLPVVLLDIQILITVSQWQSVAARGSAAVRPLGMRTLAYWQMRRVFYYLFILF